MSKYRLMEKPASELIKDYIIDNPGATVGEILDAVELCAQTFKRFKYAYSDHLVSQQCLGDARKRRYWFRK